jgi:hypothetical protein
MTPELHTHLLEIIEDAMERAEEHLDWLASHPNEPDCEAQIADTERSLDLSKQWRDVPWPSLVD